MLNCDYAEMKHSDFLSKSKFKASLNDPDSVEIVLFAATWCGYCRRFLAIVEETSSDWEIQVVDTDDEDESLWDEYNIPLVPTIVVFSRAKEIFRQNGRSGIGLLKGDLDRAIQVATKAQADLANTKQR